MAYLIAHELWGLTVTYADDLVIHDADSHLMEPLDWLEGYADEATRAKLWALDVSGGGGKSNQELVTTCWERRNDPVATAKLAADVMGGPKGFFAFGSMDPNERTAALDQLGFSAQLVFTTFAPVQFAKSDDLDLVYGGAAAHNRGIVDFCSGDRRLLPVGYLPLEDPVRAAACVDEAVSLGVRALWVNHAVPATISPTHPDYDGVWGRLAAAGVPFVFHLGGVNSNQMAASYHNNGRDPGKDFIGSGENLRSKDFPNIHHEAENLLTCFVLDGTFEQFPDLRCGVIELGAGWVPNLLRSLDACIGAFGRNEPELAKLTMKPSDYIRRQVRFTPWHFEDVGWLIDSAGPELFLFSSDWPHPEGGRDPLTEFRTSLAASGIGPGSQQCFYSDNFANFFGR